jgi:glycosidase
MQAHRRGLKVLLDFVPNHTSDQHPWFVESRVSRESQKRNWYICAILRLTADHRTTGSAISAAQPGNGTRTTGQYYYHAFLKEQPDLNWRDPAVQAAMYDVMRFWFDRGVDGFRIDVLWHLLKAADFQDNPPNPPISPKWVKCTACFNCIRQTSPRCTGSPPRCVQSQTAMAPGDWASEF